MKQKKLLALLLVLCMALSLLPTVALADETVCYTLDGTVTGGSNGYATESEITQGSITWMVMGNTTMNPWRIGGKNISGVDRTVYSKNPINETVTKVEVDVGSASNITVNSVRLLIAGDAAFESMIDDVAGAFNANSTITFTPSTGKEWTNAYYKLIFNVSVSGNSNRFLQFKAARFYKDDSGTPIPTYTVSFDAGEGSGTMDDLTTTGAFTLPECTFEAPEGYEFAGWKMDGDDTVYVAGTAMYVSADTVFTAQWTLIPVINYTDMMLKRVPVNGDEVVIYYPAAGKVMTGTDYFYNNKKHELVAADAALTDDVLAVPDEALRLTVQVDAEGKYTFVTPDGTYLEADGTHVQLVGEQGANTLFRLETAPAGTDNYYIICDSATYSGKAQYIEYYNGYFSVFGLDTGNTGIYTFQFFSEDGEGPSPAATYTVSFDANGGAGTMEPVTGASSPYTLPECTFTAPEGYEFAGWKTADGETVYAAGAQAPLTGDVTFYAQWKALPTYTNMVLKETLADGDEIVVYNPEGGVVMTGEVYLYNNTKRELKPASATLTDDVLSVPSSAAVLTVAVNTDGTYSFKNAEGKYLYSDGSNMQFVDEAGEYTLFALEEAGTSTYYIKCNTATYNDNPQYLQYYHNYFTVYGMNASYPERYAMNFYAEPDAELENGYYLIGPNWTVNDIDANNKFGVSADLGSEYLLAATLSVGDQIKVVKVENGAITAWYPDGLNNQYTVDAAHAGDVNIYFRENYVSDWAAFGGYFYIEAGYNVTCVSVGNGIASTIPSRAPAGSTVTVYLEAEEGYVLDALTVLCGETAVETTKVNDWQYTFTMPAGDVTVTATFKQPSAAEFKTQSLILSGQIGLKFYLDLDNLTDNQKESSYMTFAIEGNSASNSLMHEISESDSFDENDHNSKGYYGFTCLVSPIQMADVITATFHYDDDVTVSKTYSIKQYIDTYDNYKNLFTAQQQTLVEALANYGHYTQAFLASTNAFTVGENGKYAEMDKSYPMSFDVETLKGEVERYAISMENNTNGDIESISYSVSLEDQPVINLYFDSENYHLAFTATVGSEPWPAESLNGRYMVTITGIPAHQLGKTYHVTVSTNNGTATVDVSVLSYVQGLLNSETYANNELAQNAAASIYDYYQAAYAVKYGN